MGPSYLLHLAATVFSVLLYLGTAYWVRKQDDGRAARLFAFAMLNSGLVAAAVLGRLLVHEQGLKVLFWYARYPFMWASTVLFPAFAVTFVDREDLLNRWTVGGLAVVYVLGVGTLLVEPLGGPRLVWPGYEVVETPFRHLVPTGQGPLFPAQVLTALALIGIGLLLPTLHAVRSRRGSRLQLLFLFGAVPILTGVYAMEALGAVPVEEFDYGFVLGAVPMLLVSYGLFNTGLFEVDPVRLDDVIDAVPVGIVVVDEGRVVEYNDVAAGVFPALEGSFGESLASVAPDLVAESSPGDGRPSYVERVTAFDGDARRQYTVESSAMDGDRQVLVLRDVTALEERAEQLEQQTEQLETFASTVSHDLRNPLTVVRSYVDDAATTTDAGGTVELPGESVAAVRESLDRAFQVIDDSLTLARTGSAVEDREVVALATVARDAWRTVDTGAATLSVRCDERVYADEGRLRTLFENLFRNAVEHASPGGPAASGERHDEAGITVTVDAAEEGFHVADDGSGFDADDPLFERGYTTAEEGTGLGLAIVESIAEAHGWTVRATESAAGGARFEVGDVAFVTDDPLVEEDAQAVSASGPSDD